jgi:hypothetical protein
MRPVLENTRSVKAFAVILAVLHRVPMAKARGREIKLTTHLLEQFGVSRDAKYDALRFVEEAGMVSAEHVNGQNHVVRIIPKAGKYYVKGPLSLPWFLRAVYLGSHCALAVSTAIWYMRGLRDRDADLEITSPTWKLFGINRAAKCRSLQALEAEGLIKVVSRNYKSTVVSIIRVGDDLADAPARRTTGVRR